MVNKMDYIERLINELLEDNSRSICIIRDTHSKAALAAAEKEENDAAEKLEEEGNRDAKKKREREEEAKQKERDDIAIEFNTLIQSLRSIQDQYQLLSLHMELRNVYTDDSVNGRMGYDSPIHSERGDSNPEYRFGITPLYMFAPMIKHSIFDLEELPDLFILVSYCKFWGDKLELPFNNIELVKLVALLSKALPYPCKGRSVTSILPNSWTSKKMNNKYNRNSNEGGTIPNSDTHTATMDDEEGEDGDLNFDDSIQNGATNDNSLIYKVMSRLILASKLGIYPHCKISANFKVRRKLYREFYLTPPSAEKLSAWISKNKYLVIYIMREFLFYCIQSISAINQFMKEKYYFNDIVTNAYQAMDEVRERTNRVATTYSSLGVLPAVGFDDEASWEDYLSESRYFTVSPLMADVLVNEELCPLKVDVYQHSISTSIPPSPPTLSSKEAEESVEQQRPPPKQIRLPISGPAVMVNEEEVPNNNNEIRDYFTAHTDDTVPPPTLPTTTPPTTTTTNKKKQPIQPRITKKKIRSIHDPLVTVEDMLKYDILYLCDSAWYAHMNAILSKYNSANLDHCHRPIDLCFLDKMTTGMKVLLDANYRPEDKSGNGTSTTSTSSHKRKRKSKMSLSGVQKNNSNKQRVTKVPVNTTTKIESESDKPVDTRVFNDIVRQCIDELIARYDPETQAAVPYQCLLFPPMMISWQTIRKLQHAELLYVMETSRSEIEKAIIDIYYEDKYDFDVLNYYCMALSRRKSVASYPTPRYFLYRQQKVWKELLGVDELPPDCGSYLYCPNCCKLKTAVHDYDHTTDKYKKSSLCSAGVCIDMETGEFTCAKISSKNNPKKRNISSTITSELLTIGKEGGEGVGGEGEFMLDHMKDPTLEGNDPSNLLQFLSSNIKEGGTGAAGRKGSTSILDGMNNNDSASAIEMISAIAASQVAIAMEGGDSKEDTKEAKKASKLKRKNDLHSACVNTKLVKMNMFGTILQTTKGIACMCPQCGTITTLSRANYKNSGSVFNCGCFRFKYKTAVQCRICWDWIEDAVYRTVYNDLPITKIPKVESVPLCRRHSSSWLVTKDLTISLMSILDKLVYNKYAVGLEKGDAVLLDKKKGSTAGTKLMKKLPFSMPPQRP